VVGFERVDDGAEPWRVVQCRYTGFKVTGVKQLEREVHRHQTPLFQTFKQTG
jgi:hypothetical protein